MFHFKRENMFSIVMSVFNGEKYLNTAIESVIQQNFKEFEFIIINDGSTDDSLNIIKNWAKKDLRIKLISRENKGLIYSLNQAITISKYDYIVRMDADDICYPHRLSDALTVIKKTPNVDMIATTAHIIDINDNSVCLSRSNLTEKKILSSLPYKNFIYHPSVIYTKIAFKNANEYLTKDFGYEDLGLWLRMKENKILFKFIQKPSIKYRINTDSVRGVNSEQYIRILSMECLVNNRKKDAFKYIANLATKDLLAILIGLLTPLSLLDLYSKYKSKSKIDK